MEFFCLVSCTEDISLAVMLIFCSEGDNIPDAFTLVNHLNDWLHLLEKPVSVRKSKWIWIMIWNWAFKTCLEWHITLDVCGYRISEVKFFLSRLNIFMFFLRRRVRCSGRFLPRGGCCLAAVSHLFSSEARLKHHACIWICWWNSAGVTVLNMNQRNHWWLSGQTAQSAKYTFCL